MHKKPIIFCDFDGTVTEKDNIIAIMERFAPSSWKGIVEEIVSQKLSIRQGVGKLFSLIPTQLKDEIIQFVFDHALIRQGFPEFVQFLKHKQIPLYIVSGGIDFFVYPLLEEWIDKRDIFCNGSDFLHPFIKIRWSHPCDSECQNDCGLCKPSILRKFGADETYQIVIGDSITDLQAAKVADRVFARDYLITLCKENDISYTPFEDFTQIIDKLKAEKVII